MAQQKSKNSQMAFTKGWRQLSTDEKVRFKFRIMYLLGLSTYQGFWSRMVGLVEHSKADWDIINDEFHKYGIKDIWGE